MCKNSQVLIIPPHPILHILNKYKLFPFIMHGKEKQQRREPLLFCLDYCLEIIIVVIAFPTGCGDDAISDFKLFNVRLRSLVLLFHLPSSCDYNVVVSTMLP